MKKNKKNEKADEPALHAFGHISLKRVRIIYGHSSVRRRCRRASEKWERYKFIFVSKSELDRRARHIANKIIRNQAIIGPEDFIQKYGMTRIWSNINQG